MPPVSTCARPSATESVPSVTINAGTLALATSTPLTAPHAMPLSTAATRPAAATPGPLPPMAAITFAATTDENTSTDPTDRSMPEVMITNVIPTPSTAHTATFCDISEKLPVDRKRSPATMENATQMTISTPRIQIACRLSRRLTSDSSPSSDPATATVGRSRSDCALARRTHAAPSRPSRAPVIAPTSVSTVVSLPR